MLVRVRDIMTEHIVTVEPTTPVNDVVSLLLRHGISGLPVVDEKGNLVGLVSEYDLLKNFSEKRPSNQPVSAYMNRELHTISPEDSAAKIASRFLAERYRRFPVVENGRLVGVVSRRDILRLIESVHSIQEVLSFTESEMAAS